MRERGIVRKLEMKPFLENGDGRKRERVEVQVVEWSGTASVSDS